jgi:hypothetical protein
MPFTREVKEKLKTRSFVYQELYQRDVNRTMSDGYLRMGEETKGIYYPLMKLLINKFTFFVILIALILCSCPIDPSSEIYVSNNTSNSIYIEFELNPELNLKGKGINNNVFIEQGVERYPLIHSFPETSIINALGLGKVKNDSDIINAIDKIFIEIDVYKNINDENILLYKKNYFLENGNIKKHKNKIMPVAYSVELSVRE